MLPIIDFQDKCGCLDTVYGIPLCPHCGEWSYYTDAQAEENDGITICPFCESKMYMP